MKKIFVPAFMMLFAGLAKAQYGTINAILDKLEARRGIYKGLENVNIDNKKFVLLKNFEDHTERNFLIVKGKNATFVEMFDDKATGQSSSNVFTGDLIRNANGVISFRFDSLEGKKIALPLAKNLLLTMQKDIIYLVDVNSRERWIDEAALNKK